MTEIEIYKETVKALHNEYIEELVKVEDTLHNAYIKGLIPWSTTADLEHELSIMHATMRTACRALKIRCDNDIKAVEREEKQ